MQFNPHLKPRRKNLLARTTSPTRQDKFGRPVKEVEEPTGPTLEESIQICASLHPRLREIQTYLSQHIPPEAALRTGGQMALWAQLMSTKRELTRRELLLIREQEAEAKGVKDSQEYWAPVFDEEGEEEEVGEEEEEWEDDDDNGNGGLTIGESSTKTGESLLKTGESPSNTKREGVKDAKLGRGGAR